MGTLTHHASPTRLGRPLLILSLAFALITLISQSPVLGQPALAATRKLSAITATTGEVKDALIAGNYIIYLANYDAEERYDLYSAPLGGGVVTRLTADLPAAAIGTFAVTPAGRVVFAARQTATGLRYMYSIPAAGGQLTLLGPTYPAVRPPLISSQLVFGLAGERVIFAVDAQVANGFELYSVPAAGGPSIRLSPELPPTSGSTFPAPYWVTYFAIDDGAGQHVAFNVYQGPAPQGAGLYTVPADGSVPPTRISDALAPQLSDKLDLTPDGQRVVYTRGTELRTVRFTGGDDTLIDTGSGIPFAVTPDSARVVYALQGDFPAGATIHSFPFTTAVSTTVASGVQYAAAQTFQLTPGGTGVLYNDKDATTLLLAPMTGGITQTVIAEPVGPTGVQFTGDGARAVFRTWGSAPAIYSYPLAGGTALRIDDPTTTAAGTTEVLLAPAGEQVVYGTGPYSLGPIRLYGVPASGGAAVPLTGDLGPGQERIALKTIGPDGTVLFIAGNSIASGQTRWPWLYAVPADGSAAARLVNSPPADASLSDLALSVGTLTPAFTPGTTSYTATVTHSVTSITVTPTVSDPAATVTVNATPVTSGSASDPINLVVGTNPTIVKVTAADGSSGTYTITVFRAGSADVAITQTYKLGGQPAALAATTNALTLTITVGNYGPDDVAGVVVIDQFPPAVAGTGWTWICAGAACPVDSGTGDLHATLGLLPKDDAVVFTVTGALRNPHDWRNVPAVVTPMGVVDESIGNNTVIVGRYGVFLPAIRR